MKKFEYFTINIEDYTSDDGDFDIDNVLKIKSLSGWEFCGSVDNNTVCIFKREVIKESKYLIDKVYYHNFTESYLQDKLKKGYKYISHSYSGNPNFEFVIVFEIINENNR